MNVAATTLHWYVTKQIRDHHCPKVWHIFILSDRWKWFHWSIKLQLFRRNVNPQYTSQRHIMKAYLKKTYLPFKVRLTFTFPSESRHTSALARFVLACITAQRNTMLLLKAVAVRLGMCSFDISNEGVADAMNTKSRTSRQGSVKTVVEQQNMITLEFQWVFLRLWTS